MCCCCWLDDSESDLTEEDVTMFAKILDDCDIATNVLRSDFNKNLDHNRTVAQNDMFYRSGHNFANFNIATDDLEAPGDFNKQRNGVYIAGSEFVFNNNR